MADPSRTIYSQRHRITSRPSPPFSCDQREKNARKRFSFYLYYELSLEMMASSKSSKSSKRIRRWKGGGRRGDYEDPI